MLTAPAAAAARFTEIRPRPDDATPRSAPAPADWQPRQNPPAIAPTLAAEATQLGKANVVNMRSPINSAEACRERHAKWLAAAAGLDASAKAAKARAARRS